MLDVCAAVIVRDGQFLLASRPPGRHLEGKWEFPGGKVHDGETLEACICREISEELGLTIRDPVFLTTVEHRYQEKHVRLHFMVGVLTGEAEPICHDGQQAGWFSLARLTNLDLAPADRSFVDWIRRHHDHFVN